MRPFQIEETEGVKSAWIYPEADGEFEPVKDEPEPGRVALKVRYFTPAEREALFHRMVRVGVMKRKMRRGGESLDLVPERRQDRDRMFAEALVLDWRGILSGGQPVPYSPEEMARVLGARQDIYTAVWAAVDEIGLFFGTNGHAT